MVHLTMSSFQERFKRALGPKGYETCMRRSVQSVVLYEARRCISTQLPSLRPFQRRIAFWDQAVALIKQSDLLPHHREEIMWRTGTSKALMDPETAWKRMKIIEKELEKLISEKVKPSYREGMSHDQLCKEFVQKVFETQTNQAGKQCPENWEHAHNNVIMTYKMYYDGLQLDPTLPEPAPVVEINVPHEKPAPIDGAAVMRSPGTVRYSATSSLAQSGPIVPRPAAQAAAAAPSSSLTSSSEESHEERLRVLREVKEYMEVLQKFEGVIHDDFLAKRKRELFEALPSLPPSSAERTRKRQRTV